MILFRSNAVSRIAVALAVWMSCAAAQAQVNFDREPIRYSDAEANDPIAKLQKRIDDGEVQLQFEGKQGYLKALLEALDVSVHSQMLVFSKTSFQQRLITPRAPRALYFNDDVYIGFVQRGDVLEISAVDEQQGAIFYTLKQEQKEKPRFVRDRGNCLTCHASSRTRDVPGHLVRSVYPSPSGMPHFGSGTFLTNQESPLKERWGGWYVSGTHGMQRHMGNVVSQDDDRPEILDVEAGANITDLSDLVDTEPYLTGHSDIVALLVLEHQGDMHNLLTHANYATRTALYQSESMNRVLDRPEGYLSESTVRRIKNAATKVVKYMLFCDEAELTAPIRGTSDFAEHFATIGPFDRQGRSLRQFDLDRRIFRYPCSYLIYSDAFDGLPDEVKQQVYRQLWDVLAGDNDDEDFAHLTAENRRAILEILRETKQDLPTYWTKSS